MIVGNRVHVKQYVSGVADGIITDIYWARNGDGKRYLAADVEYDAPVPGRWPYCARVLRRGTHALECLELL